MRGLLAVVIALGVIGAIVLSGGAPANPPQQVQPAQLTPAPGEIPTTGTPGTPVYPVKIVIEAEDCKERADVEKNTGNTLLRINTNQQGKSITYLEVPEEMIKKCGLEKQKEQIAALPGRVSYVFEAPRDDVYYINVRAKWSDTCGNSVWLRMNGSDNSEFLNLEDEDGKIGDKNYKWVWHQLQVGGQPKGFKLAKGQHTLWMNVREDGVQLDQWLITTEASKQTGDGPLKKAGGS
ncbi:MAG TPA: hypothetical protein VEK08_11095 [Planctomycetota bacterium]|nr:hypothetical protein [Planctomycetota bacterium]